MADRGRYYVSVFRLATPAVFCKCNKRRGMPRGCFSAVCRVGGEGAGQPMLVISKVSEVGVVIVPVAQPVLEPWRLGLRSLRGSVGGASSLPIEAKVEVGERVHATILRWTRRSVGGACCDPLNVMRRIR
jgi:hypothetical protein